MKKGLPGPHRIINVCEFAADLLCEENASQVVWSACPARLNRLNPAFALRDKFQLIERDIRAFIIVELDRSYVASSAKSHLSSSQPYFEGIQTVSDPQPRLACID